MKHLLLLSIPLALLGASCAELPDQFVAKHPIQEATEVTAHHLVLDLYSNRDEHDSLSYQDQIEIWYAPELGAQINHYSFDESGQPILTHRAYDDIAAGQTYTEVPVEGTPTPDNVQPYIEALRDEPNTTEPSMAELLLADVLTTNPDWISDQAADYTITERTTSDTGFETTQAFMIDHVTNEVKQVDELYDDKPYSRLVVSKRELNRYDTHFFTLAGWRNSLSNPNLPLESEL